jgi:DNA (cytosine-5)-methyltransferase 1
MNYERTLGSVPAGIGGFDIGFERAGWDTLWQIELDDVNRAVLADRFPRARQYKDLRDWRSYSLPRVAAVVAGFPCQDISNMGAVAAHRQERGLKGSRSGLFFTIMEIIGHLQPPWVVLENVPALLHSNDCEDIQIVIGELAQRGYVGFWRVLDAQYFGIPQKRRRILLVAGLGTYPHMDFLADAGTVESLPASAGSQWLAKHADAWAGYTLTAPDKYAHQSSRTNLGSELLVVEEDGWSQMAHRAREIELHGLSMGLDAANAEEAYGAGNAFPPPMAEWVAQILNRSSAGPRCAKEKGAHAA